MTKMKSTQLALLLVAMLFSVGNKAQSVYFNYTDGTNAIYNLQDVRKITFNADVMNLHLWDGSQYAWNVNTINYYRYDETIVTTQEWLNMANVWQMKVFPNPSSTSLNVQFMVPKEDNVSIALTDLQGKLLLKKNLGTKTVGQYHEALDLTTLSQGTYLCRISALNTTITKQVIKQ